MTRILLLGHLILFCTIKCDFVRIYKRESRLMTHYLCKFLANNYLLSVYFSKQHNRYVAQAIIPYKIEDQKRYRSRDIIDPTPEKLFLEMESVFKGEKKAAHVTIGQYFL